jgi:hypothetical protein
VKKNVSVKILVVAVPIILVGVLLLFISRSPAPFFSDVEKPAHFYDGPSRAITDLRLKIFYVVPEDKAAQVATGWRETINQVLEKAADFHRFQFRGKSELNYDVYPEIVILKNKSVFYDTEKTDRGNPKALIAIAQELEGRAFSKGGDLYSQNFVFRKEGEYPVLGIVYEGVGAGGGVIFESQKESVAEIAKQFKIPESMIFKVDVKSADGFFIISRQFLTDSQYALFRDSLFYHEFAHTFGLPDLYDWDSNIPFSDDIMGSGRREPIETTYLGRDLLKNLGVIQ